MEGRASRAGGGATFSPAGLGAEWVNVRPALGRKQTGAVSAGPGQFAAFAPPGPRNMRRR